MASIQETLYKFGGDATSLLNELRKIEKKAGDLPEEEVITIRAEVAKALADMELVKKQADQLEKDNPTITPRLNVRSIARDISKATTALNKLPGQQEVDIQVGKIDVKENEVKAAIKKIEVELERLSKLDPQVKVDAQIDQAMARFGQVEVRLANLQKKKATPKVEADIQKAETDLQVIEVRINELSALDPTVKVEAQIAAAEVKLLKLQAILQSLEAQRHEIKVDVDRRALGNLRTAVNAIGNIEQAVKRAEAAFQVSESVTKAFGAAWANVSQAVRRVGPFLMGLGIILAASLVPALLAVGLAAGGAVAGVGALATAFAATLVPAIVGALGVLSRFKAITEAMTAQEQARKEAVQNAAGADERAAAAADTLRNARRGLNDATKSVTRAEQALKDARRVAGENIAAGEQAFQDATNRSAQAARDLAKATQDAYQTIRDAIEEASDAAREFERSQIDSAQAALNVDKAKLALQDFKKEAGAAGDELAKVFTKFTDVSVDTSGLEGAISKASGAAQGKGGLDKSQQLELRQLILDVRDAKESEKEATDHVSDAEKRMNDTAKVAATLKKKGIGAVDGYRSALTNLEDAQKKTAAAQKDYNDLLDKGISKAPGVIAAQQSLADANLAASRAQQDFVGTQKKVQSQMAGTSTAMDDFKRKWSDLTGAEQRWALAQDKIKQLFKDMSKSMSGPVLTSLTNLTNNFKNYVPLLESFFNRLGKSWGDTIDKFSQEFHPPQGLLDFQGILNGLKFSRIFDGAIKLSNDFGSAAVAAFGLFVNVAVAALPHVERLADKFTKFVQGLQSATGDTQSLSDALAPAVTTLERFADIGKNSVTAIWNAFSAGSGPINDFLKWISDGIKSFSDWAKSAKGKNEIKDFFAEVLPFVKSLIKFVIKIGQVFLIAFKVLAPILKPIVDMFNSFLDVFIFLLKIVDKILGPFKTLIGVLLTFLIPFGKIGQGAGLLLKSLGKLPGFLGKLGKVFGGIGKVISGPFKKAWDTVIRIARAVWPRIKAVVRGGINAVVGVVKTVVKFISAPFRSVLNRVKGFFDDFFKGIKIIWGLVKDFFIGGLKFIKRRADTILRVFQGIAGGIEDAFQGMLDFLTGAFDTVWGIIKGGINFLIDGVNWVIDQLNKIQVKVPDFVPVIGGQQFGISLPQIPHLAQGGVLTGSTLFQGGEKGREAVLPLTRAMYSSLAQEIVKAMRPLVNGRSMATAASGGVQMSKATTINVDKIVVDAPRGHTPDARATAVALARELERRGGTAR